MLHTINSGVVCCCSSHILVYSGIKCCLKERERKTITILLPFTHPHVLINMYDILASVDHKRRYLKKKKSLFVHSMKVKWV